MTRSLRVLLVEDSRILAERLSETIANCQNVELVAQADTEMGALIVVSRELIDVVVLDLHLKQGTGFGVLRRLTQAASGARVIVLTNYDLPEYKRAALSLGAAYFLDKARDYERLPEILNEIVGLAAMEWRQTSCSNDKLLE